MIISAVFFAAMGLGQGFKVPTEASPEFRKLASEIEDALVSVDFDKGSKLVSQLPKANVAYHLDFGTSNSTTRAGMIEKIKKAANEWNVAMDGSVTFSQAETKDSDITILIGQNGPQNFTWVSNGGKSRLVATISRDSKDNYQERLIFAKYLGLASVSKGKSFDSKEVFAAKSIQSLVRLLSDSVQSLAPSNKVPIGSSSEFHHLVLDIEKALIDKDFSTAERLKQLLPQPKVSWSMDVSKLTADQKLEYVSVADTAFEQWHRALGKDVEFKKVPVGKADIALSFEPKLAEVAGTSTVAGAATFLGVDATQPRIETVIGLKRGPKLATILPREVFNECLFSIGRYLGLAPNPLVGSAMGRIDGQMSNANIITQQELRSVHQIYTLTNFLKSAIQKHQAVATGQPTLSLEATKLEFAPQLQGDGGTAKMLVTNTGNVPLELDLRGDCGCIGGTVESSLAPGKSTFLTGYFNTTELTGDVHHNLILKTNDPDRPIVIIPVSISVTPRAEFVFPVSNTAYMDGDDKSFVFYVGTSEAKVFNILSSSVAGLPLTVKTDPFEGDVPNFMKFGKKQKIHGYKLTVDLANMNPALLIGRASANVYLRTDNPKLGNVKAQFFVQKGIVCLPESVYFGSPKGIADSAFVVIRVGRPFEIKSITSDSQYLTFEVTPNAPTNPSAYTVRAIYDGKSPGHKLKGTITIETSDPKQPVLKVPFQTSQT